ncbi:MAG TPA: hypothetical protein VN854_00810, partial [Mycoplasmatales bacterium]|nr:hypothetical protein [Mycoplasmatales bacterium]
NGLFNSGINGIIQVVVKYFFQKSNHKYNFLSLYYSSVFLVNAFIILVVEKFIPGNFKINSTAFLYVILQFIWSKIFGFFSLKNYVFNRLAPKTWGNISNEGQLALTLPFYVIISMFASVLHSYGYSLIYKAKSSPGGLDIITSTITQNEDKKKGERKSFSIGKFSKIFGLLVIFAITFFDFIFVENNKNLTLKQLMKRDFFNESNIENEEDLYKFIGSLNYSNQESKKLLEKISDSLGIEIIDPNFIINYLKEGKIYLIKYYKSSNNEYRLKQAEDNFYEKSLFGYIKYITNNEKFWASLVYIFLSSYFINDLFPKSKIIKISFITKNEEELEELKRILKNHKFYYFDASSFSNVGTDPEQIGKIRIFCCLITKWGYQLISDKLKRFEKVAVYETDEKG